MAAQASARKPATADGRDVAVAGKEGGKGASRASKPRAPTLTPRTAVKSATRKTTPTAKRQMAETPPKLKLVAAGPVAKAQVRAVPETVAPKPVRDEVRIFQIYYRPEQQQFLDPAFEPYNNEGDNSPLLEFNVFRKLVNSEMLKGAGLWGALSWKFKEKTGLSGEQLLQIIAANPGHDVYYCNPFPELEAVYHNLWLQGETSHPNFLILCRDFFQAAGLEEGAFAQLVPSSHFAASNYFVATPRFWRGYVGFISAVVASAEKGMSATARAMIYSAAADRKAMHAGASYMPFIIERLFSLYIARTQGQYKTLKFGCERQEAKLNVHLRLLRQMKDVAISSKSLWLATCWINYRNVYMQQLHGADWCNRYLRDVTPVNVNF